MGQGFLVITCLRADKEKSVFERLCDVMSDHMFILLKKKKKMTHTTSTAAMSLSIVKHCCMLFRISLSPLLRRALRLIQDEELWGKHFHESSLP